MFDNCILRPDGIPSIDFDQLCLNSVGLNRIWKLWNPDVLWRASSGWCTYLFPLPHVKEGGLPPMPGANGLARLSWEHGVPSREARGLRAKVCYANALIILESELCFFLSSQSWSCRLRSVNILTGEAVSNCLHSEAENQTYPCWTNNADGMIPASAQSILTGISLGNKQPESFMRKIHMSARLLTNGLGPRDCSWRERWETH